jgi:hypothetical protein
MGTIPQKNLKLSLDVVGKRPYSCGNDSIASSSCRGNAGLDVSGIPSTTIKKPSKQII